MRIGAFASRGHVLWFVHADTIAPPPALEHIRKSLETIRRAMPIQFGSIRVIGLHGIVKRYRNTLAVNHVTMTVQSGEIFGFLGTNSAGAETGLQALAMKGRGCCESTLATLNCSTEE